MNLLNRYLLKQFIKFFTTVSFGFISLYILIDFFEKFDNFTEAGKPITEVIKFFVYSIPAVVDQLGPIFILLSGIITLGILNHSNELTALKAGGLPLRKIVNPLIAGGTMITLLFLFAAQFLLPITAQTTNDIWVKGIKGKTAVGIVRNNRFYYRGENGFYSFKWPDTTKPIFLNFSYSKWNSEHKTQEIITADQAHYIASSNEWTLINGQIQQEIETGNYKSSSFEQKIIRFPEKPDDFLTPQNVEAESSLVDLYKQVGNKKADYEIQEAWTIFLGRISYITLGLPLLLLGLPILLISYKKWGRDLSIAIPASCGLAFAAWAVWGALQSLAIAGKFSPWLAAVLIHLVFATAGIFLLRQFDK